MMIDRLVKGLGVWPVCSRRQPPFRPCISVDKTNPYSSHALAATAERVAYSNYDSNRSGSVSPYGSRCNRSWDLFVVTCRGEWNRLGIAGRLGPQALAVSERSA
jgi:hypothetical protein